MTYIRIALLLAALLIIPFMVGIALRVITGCRRYKISFARTYVDGFITWMAAYQILYVLALQCKWSLAKLTLLWEIVTATFIVISFIFGLKQYAYLFADIKKSACVWSKYKVLAFALIAVIFIIAVFFENGSVTDDAFYVGESFSTLVTGELWTCDPYTGKYIDSNGKNILLDKSLWTGELYTGRYAYVKSLAHLKKYVLSGYPILVASISEVTGIAVAVVTHIGMCVISVIISLVSYYLLVNKIFHDSWKVWGAMCVICVMMITGNYGTESPATFLLTGAWLGKSWLSNVIIPLLLYYIIEIISRKRFTDNAGLILCSISGGLFSTMGMVLVPAFVFVTWLAGCIGYRRIGGLLSLGFAIVPHILLGIMYLKL